MIERRGFVAWLMALPFWPWSKTRKLPPINLNDPIQTTFRNYVYRNGEMVEEYPTFSEKEVDDAPS